MTSPSENHHLHLVLGGARSGKSRFAEQSALDYVQQGKKQLIYLATAQAHDQEMAKRISRHQQNRDHQWQLVEEPLLLADRLQQCARPDTCILLDCLTLWLSNLLLHEDGRYMESEQEALLNVLPELPGRIIMVSNTVGMGVVPMGEISRQFVDQSGLLEQSIAALCKKVTLVVAGLPMVLK